MAESKRQEHDARLNLNRAFLNRLSLAIPDKKAQLVFWSLLAAGLIGDLWSKKAVFNWLGSRGSITVIDGFLRLVMAENTGAAFGIAAGQRFLLVAVSIVALLIVIGIFFFSQTKQRLFHIALGLFAGGICGNLYDRIFNAGRVRDFIDVVYWPGKHWPAFNLADSLLCISVGLLIISGFRTSKKACSG